jgi:hypothetical protein
VSASAGSLAPSPVPSETMPLICSVISAAFLYPDRLWFGPAGSIRPVSGLLITGRPFSILAVDPT